MVDRNPSHRDIPLTVPGPRRNRVLPDGDTTSDGRLVSVAVTATGVRRAVELQQGSTVNRGGLRRRPRGRDYLTSVDLFRSSSPVGPSSHRLSLPLYLHMCVFFWFYLSLFVGFLGLRPPTPALPGLCFCLSVFQSHFWTSLRLLCLHLVYRRLC